MIIVDIPDMHGSHAWKIVKTLAKDHPDYYFVSHGDWFDSGYWDDAIKDVVEDNKWPDQGDNFSQFMNWVREDPIHRFALVGNHDWQYWTSNRDATCSGNQYSHASEIRALLNANKDLLKVAVELDGWVFSHAGFTKTWMHSFTKEMHMEKDEWPDDDTGNPGKVWDESELSIYFINKEFQNHTHVLGDETCISQFDELFDWHGFMASDGDEITQGPLWVRPSSLLRDAYYPQQVVGHTGYAIDRPVKLFSKNAKIYIGDSEEKDLITIFDTENPGMFITLSQYNKYCKKLYKVINNIKSQQITDIDVIKNELTTIGVKNTDRYIKRFFPKLAKNII